MKITIEAESKEIAALLGLIKEPPKKEQLSPGQAIKGITIPIGPFEKSASHDTRQE